MRPLLATLAFLTLLSARAFAGEGETLALCEEPGSEEREAAVILSRWMRSARVEVRKCAPGSLPPRRLAFVPGPDGSVVVRLETATARREREVPWLERSDAALSRLRTKGALARFSVIVEALLAEDRLAAPVTPVVLAPRPPHAQQPSRKPPQKPADPAPAPAPSLPAPPAIEPLPPMPAPVFAIPPPAVAAPPSEPEKPSASPVPEAPAVEPAKPVKRWAFGIDGGAGYHLRSPYVSTGEFGGGLHYGPIRLAVTYQPEAVLALEGDRQIGINVLAFSLGGRFELLEADGFELGVLANALLDYLVAFRKDTGNPYDATDFGVSGGLFAARRLGPAGAELRVEGIVMPTAHVIEIPNGPAKLFNLFGLRVTLSFFWDLWQPGSLAFSGPDQSGPNPTSEGTWWA
ncbi:MAG TPA: hypothetical protein VGK67_38700 [Myxococcales bacterium]